MNKKYGINVKRIIIISALFVFAVNSVYAQLTVSGILDSTVSFSASTGDSDTLQNFSMGIEEFANIRFQAKRENYSVYGAVNLLAASGDYASNAARMAYLNTASSLASTSYVSGDNYVAAIELERLYFRLIGEYTNFDGGLMRLPFGYGQVWGSSDFLNPKNPLKPDARPRGILGAAFSWFPVDEIKLLMFYSAPRYAFSKDGRGSFAGLSLDRHWNKISIQSLYSYETPDAGYKYGIHRIGQSIKADIKMNENFEFGLIMDALYTYNHEAETAQDGLSFSAGIDYSFFKGRLIFLTEYLFNGENSSTAYDPQKNILGSANEHNIYTGFTLRFSDFTNLITAFIFSFADVSYTPLITLNHELFQGASLIIAAQAPFENNSFYGVNLTARIRLRF